MEEGVLTRDFWSVSLDFPQGPVFFRFSFRTALMLGCEYGCRDAVEILIKNGADVSLLDALGHDSPYYARIGDNLDILTLLKTASENTSKGTGTFVT